VVEGRARNWRERETPREALRVVMGRRMDIMGGLDGVEEGLSNGSRR